MSCREFNASCITLKIERTVLEVTSMCLGAPEAHDMMYGKDTDNYVFIYFLPWKST